MVIAVISSLILFLRIKGDSIIFPKVFFWNYALAFAILSVVNLPIFFINLGVEIHYNALVFLYLISFLGVLVSYLLFYRSTLFLITKDNFFINIFPFIFITIFTLFSLFALFASKIEIFLIYTAGVWGFLLPFNAFLGSIFIYFFLKGIPNDSIKKYSFSSFLLSIGWFILLFTDISLWLISASYPNEFWILKIASAKGWFLLRSASYLIILIGVLLYSKQLHQVERDIIS